MYWTRVLGYRLPKPVGGHPALDFCDTYAGWNGPPLPRGEWLPDYDQFTVFTVHAGLLSAEDAAPVRALGLDRPAEAAEVLGTARELRANLYAVLLDPGDTAAFGVVAGLAAEAAAHAELSAGEDGVAHWRIPSTVDLRLPLRLLSQSAAELLCSSDRTLVRACPGDECGWLFFDRRGRRRWCNMATCGNRAKVRAFEERQRNG
ncbi:MAG TPA: ABATE domain-containing protein [Phytomonospora sp.]